MVLSFALRHETQKISKNKEWNRSALTCSVHVWDLQGNSVLQPCSNTSKLHPTTNYKYTSIHLPLQVLCSWWNQETFLDTSSQTKQPVVTQTVPHVVLLPFTYMQMAFCIMLSGSLSYIHIMTWWCPSSSSSNLVNGF